VRTDNNVRLPDGRNLSYAEFGKPDGYPVLYFHGTPSSRLEPLLFAKDEVIARLGLRMIAAGRPSTIASWMF